MQSVLRFEPLDEHTAKRRKSAKACSRCQQAKKRCSSSSQCNGACQRCTRDGHACSFEGVLPSPASLDISGSDNVTIGSRLGCGAWQQDGASTQTVASRAADHVESQTLPPQSIPEQPMRPHNEVYPPHDTSQAAADLDSPEGITNATLTPWARCSLGRKARSELRFATMLDVLQDASQRDKLDESTPTKLIGDTNPLSALLRKDLKHRIINNLCAFRAPDPRLDLQRPQIRRLASTNSWDWDSYYASLDIRLVKLNHLRALGCFRLPNAIQSGQLLDVYFTRVHPFLPILDRRDFLSNYYSHAKRPPLVQLVAVFLAAARYCASAFDCVVVDDCESVRDICDLLHQRLRALIDVDVLSERTAVLQAAILGSLHWEGREGVNSSLDSLGVAIRIAQEMGLHRHTVVGDTITGSLSRRRIWWCIFALDRFNAATEGTPLIINELDCDVAPLTPSDFEDEDATVRNAALLNVDLALVINDAIRWLYSPSVKRESLHSRVGEMQRDGLSRRLDELETRAVLLDPSFTVFRAHINAVRTMVHRPFLLHQETCMSDTINTASTIPLYKSREACRIWSSETIWSLKCLRAQSLLQYTWPFTVYALVNALLIVWYDFSGPQEVVHAAQARTSLLHIIELLREMGSTWWAAAAKHKLAQALLRIGDRLRERTRTQADGARELVSGGYGQEREGVPQTNASAGFGGTGASFGLQQSAINDAPLDDLLDWPGLGDGADFWPLLGIDFETELAQGIYSIT